MLIVIYFLMACSPVSLPDVLIPPNTLLLRESFQGPGPERTGNWWGRFDDEGCWWEAHNTWLFVSDPELMESSSWFLHWNGVEGEHPWFCLTEKQILSLRGAIKMLDKGSTSGRYTGAVERWTVQTMEGPVSHVVPRDSYQQQMFPLYKLFGQFSTDGVWGQSPESNLVEVREPHHP